MNATRRPRLTRDAYVEGVLRGHRAILSQAITLIESTRPADVDLAQDVLEGCLPHAGNSIRVGITGPPGVGKSSMIEVLGTHITRERREKVAVLAVDPSSQLSSGSILADKTRMETLANDDLAFVRPSPSGGALGGVARRTREAMLMCEAAGYSNVLIETVGVGQSETAVRSMVDFFVLLMQTGAGDELQGIKRGIVEMTDLIAFNKADGDNRAAAEAAKRDVENALRLFSWHPAGNAPRVVTCSAKEREGISEIWQTAVDHVTALRTTGRLETHRRDQMKTWLHELIDQSLRNAFLQHPAVKEALPGYEKDVFEGRLTPARATAQLLEFISIKREHA